MPDQPETASLTWRDGEVPVSTRFDDPYFSITDGLSETRHVFLEGNDLPARFKAGFHIAELGFGTGLNLLAAWSLWRSSGIDGVLKYSSFEAFPMAINDVAKSLSIWPELSELCDEFLAYYQPSTFDFHARDLQFNLIVGDARDTLPKWNKRADAWFLDGFSPAKNPQLWQGDLLQAVADHTAPNGTFATYSAAGEVRRALGTAGFIVERIKGFANKRHMSIGTLR